MTDYEAYVGVLRQNAALKAWKLSEYYNIIKPTFEKNHETFKLVYDLLPFNNIFDCPKRQFEQINILLEGFAPVSEEEIAEIDGRLLALLEVIEEEEPNIDLVIDLIAES